MEIHPSKKLALEDFDVAVGSKEKCNNWDCKAGKSIKKFQCMLNTMLQ